jgi:hypothetical protein
LILCGIHLVLQAAILDCGSFDPFSFEKDGLSAAEVDVGRREIVQALVITAMIVVIDEMVVFARPSARAMALIDWQAARRMLIWSLSS